MKLTDIEARVRAIAWPEPSPELRARVLTAAPRRGPVDHLVRSPVVLPDVSTVRGRGRARCCSRSIRSRAAARRPASFRARGQPRRRRRLKTRVCRLVFRPKRPRRSLAGRWPSRARARPSRGLTPRRSGRTREETTDDRDLGDIHAGPAATAGSSSCSASCCCSWPTSASTPGPAIASIQKSRASRRSTAVEVSTRPRCQPPTTVRVSSKPPRP